MQNYKKITNIPYFLALFKNSTSIYTWITSKVSTLRSLHFRFFFIIQFQKNIFLLGNHLLCFLSFATHIGGLPLLLWYRLADSFLFNFHNFTYFVHKIWKLWKQNKGLFSKKNYILFTIKVPQMWSLWIPLWSGMHYNWTFAIIVYDFEFQPWKMQPTSIGNYDPTFVIVSVFHDPWLK